MDILDVGVRQRMGGVNLKTLEGSRDDSQCWTNRQSLPGYGYSLAAAADSQTIRCSSELSTPGSICPRVTQTRVRLLVTPPVFGGSKPLA